MVYYLDIDALSVYIRQYQIGVRHMKRLEVKLNEAEQKRLEALRRKYDDYRSERALAILHSADGMTAIQNTPNNSVQS